MDQFGFKTLEQSTADNERIVATARMLAEKLIAIHDDSRYKGVWTFYHVHGQKYDGPTYDIELANLRKALGV